MQDPQKNIKGFTLIYSGQVFSLLGSSLVRFTLIWWLTELTGSPQVLATASLMSYLPDLLIGPFAGVFADRLDRKKIMIAADGFTALATGALVLLYLRGGVDILLIYGLLFARSLGSSFHFPALEASIALMVPGDKLQRVSGVQQSLNGLVNIIGPPFSAFLIAFLPIEVVLSFDIITAFIAILPLLFVRIPQPEARETPITVTSVLSDLKTGFRFLLGWRALLLFALMIMLVHIVAIPAMSFMSLLVTDAFAGGVNEFAVMESVFGIGLLAGGVGLTLWGGFKRKTRTILFSLILCGVGSIVIGLSPGNQFNTALAGTFIFSCSVSVVPASIGALQKSVIPSDVQGRVFTLIRSGTNAMPALGLAIAGPVTQFIGVQAWYLVGGCVFILTGLLASLCGDVVNIEDNKQGNLIFSELHRIS